MAFFDVAGGRECLACHWTSKRCWERNVPEIVTSTGRWRWLRGAAISCGGGSPSIVACQHTLLCLPANLGKIAAHATIFPIPSGCTSVRWTFQLPFLPARRCNFRLRSSAGSPTCSGAWSSSKAVSPAARLCWPSSYARDNGGGQSRVWIRDEKAKPGVHALEPAGPIDRIHRTNRTDAATMRLALVADDFSGSTYVRG